MDNHALEQYFSSVLSSHRVMLDAMNTLKQQEETIRQLARLPRREGIETPSNTSLNTSVPTQVPLYNTTRRVFPIRTPQSNQLSEMLNQSIVDVLNNLTPVVVRPTELQIEHATETMLFSELPSDIEKVYSCPVSHELFNDNSEITRICHCGHYFGKEAIMRWFSMNVRCPICRYDIRTATTDADEDEDEATDTDTRADTNATETPYVTLNVSPPTDTDTNTRADTNATETPYVTLNVSPPTDTDTNALYYEFDFRYENV